MGLNVRTLMLSCGSAEYTTSPTGLNVAVRHGRVRVRTALSYKFTT